MKFATQISPLLNLNYSKFNDNSQNQMLVQLDPTNQNRLDIDYLKLKIKTIPKLKIMHKTLNNVTKITICLPKLCKGSA